MHIRLSPCMGPHIVNENLYCHSVWPIRISIFNSGPTLLPICMIIIILANDGNLYGLLQHTDIQAGAWDRYCPPDTEFNRRRDSGSHTRKWESKLRMSNGIVLMYYG